MGSTSPTQVVVYVTSDADAPLKFMAMDVRCMPPTDINDAFQNLAAVP